LNVPGQTSGTIDFTIVMTNVTRTLRSSVPMQVAVSLWDAARHQSNAVLVTVPSWIVPAL
jgi:hypothetical protein